MSPELAARRRAMVSEQLAARKIHDARVLAAMGEVPRERFVPADLAEAAYFDSPLPIGEGQTISQPYVVAWMLEALGPQPADRALEIGAGSGYAAAVLSRLVAQVFTIERLPDLCAMARAHLAENGFANVQVRCGDGMRGWPEEAPFNIISVAAGAASIPAPFRAQLALGGRLVMPVGADPRQQMLVRVTRVGEREFRTDELGGVRFVPLIGGD